MMTQVVKKKNTFLTLIEDDDGMTPLVPMRRRSSSSGDLLLYGKEGEELAQTLTRLTPEQLQIDRLNGLFRSAPVARRPSTGKFGHKRQDSTTSTSTCAAESTSDYPTAVVSMSSSEYTASEYSPLLDPCGSPFPELSEGGPAELRNFLLTPSAVATASRQKAPRWSAMEEDVQDFLPLQQRLWLEAEKQHSQGSHFQKQQTAEAEARAKVLAALAAARESQAPSALPCAHTALAITLASSLGAAQLSWAGSGSGHSYAAECVGRPAALRGDGGGAKGSYHGRGGGGPTSPSLGVAAPPGGAAHNGGAYSSAYSTSGLVFPSAPANSTLPPFQPSQFVTYAMAWHCGQQLLQEQERQRTEAQRQQQQQPEAPTSVKPAQEGEKNQQALDAPPTTLMIRNVPNRYSQGELITELDDLGFAESFDFLYIPLDKGSQSNVGYAFVNFVSATWAEKCMTTLEGYCFKKHRHTPGKTATVSIAHLQGLVANIRHYERTVVNTARVKQRRPVIMANMSRTMDAALSQFRGHR